jgi:hypothetical protein
MRKPECQRCDIGPPRDRRGGEFAGDASRSNHAAPLLNLVLGARSPSMSRPSELPDKYLRTGMFRLSLRN